MAVAEKVITINIAKDFSKTPGPRFRSEGNFSGEQFRTETLEKAFGDALRDNVQLFIDLDGGYGYATSFLEEAFGGLARIYNPSDVLRMLTFKSDEEPYLIEDIE